MRNILVKGRKLRDGRFQVTQLTENSGETHVSTDDWNTLMQVLRHRGPEDITLDRNNGFEYSFPILLRRTINTNAFRIDFPVIFE